MNKKIYIRKGFKKIFKQGTTSTIPPSIGEKYVGRALDIEGKRYVTLYEVVKVIKMTNHSTGFSMWRDVCAIVNEYYYAEDYVKVN